MSDIIIFNRPYNVCPRYPEGTKWEVYQHSRYSSCGWNMETFGEAIAYLRQMWAKAQRDKAERRLPGAEHCENEFWGNIYGPGGRMDWNTIEALVKRVQS